MKDPDDRWAYQTQVFAGDLRVKDYWSTTNRQKELITSFRVCLPVVSLRSLDSIPRSWSDHLRWSASSFRHFLIYSHSFSQSLFPCLSLVFPLPLVPSLRLPFVFLGSAEISMQPLVDIYNAYACARWSSLEFVFHLVGRCLSRLESWRASLFTMKIFSKL